MKLYLKRHPFIPSRGKKVQDAGTLYWQTELEKGNCTTILANGLTKLEGFMTPTEAELKEQHANSKRKRQLKLNFSVKRSKKKVFRVSTLHPTVPPPLPTPSCGFAGAKKTIAEFLTNRGGNGTIFCKSPIICGDLPFLTRLLDAVISIIANDQLVLDVNRLTRRRSKPSSKLAKGIEKHHQVSDTVVEALLGLSRVIATPLGTVRRGFDDSLKSTRGAVWKAMNAYVDFCKGEQLFHQIVCLHVALSVSLRFPKHLVCIHLVAKSLICTLYIIINNNIRICIIMHLVSKE